VVISLTYLLYQTIAPLCVEVAGLKQLPSLLSLSWLAVVLPTTCACVDIVFVIAACVFDANSIVPQVSEIVALYLRRPSHARPYLYTQIFCGGCYICASFCLWGVRTLRKRQGTNTEERNQ
jgi:hypothetical protein